MYEKDITKLQRVQNCLTIVVINTQRFSRSVPILKRLHIYFKISTVTFQTLKDIQPAHLADLFVRPKCQP